MERILVCMEGRHGAWEALSHAMLLAKRIGAKVHVLRVFTRRGQTAPAEEALAAAVGHRLDQVFEAAKSDGVVIEHFVAEGNFEDEVVRFTEHNKITLLVAESGEGETRASDGQGAAIQKIRHRISCRVELVSPRRNLEPKQHEG